MPSRYLESTVLYFFEKERDREVYYSICEWERENLRASRIHVSQNTRKDAGLYIAKWARFWKSINDKRKFKPLERQMIKFSITCRSPVDSSIFSG